MRIRKSNMSMERIKLLFIMMLFRDKNKGQMYDFGSLIEKSSQLVLTSNF